MLLLTTQSLPSFLKSYYQLLESAELQVKDVQNTFGVLIETETGQENNLVFNATRIGSAKTNIDEGDKILLEETELMENLLLVK